MFGAVIITLIITVLVMLVILLLDVAKKQDLERERLRKNNERLNSHIAEMRMQENLRRECAAYDKGLYDGRSTDTLYRKMLDKYSSGERATVMMYGENNKEDVR